MKCADPVKGVVLRSVLKYGALMLTVTMLCAAAAIAKPAETCLTGTAADVSNDPSQIRAVRALVDAGCDCSIFDGSKGHTHGDYVRCAWKVIRAQVPGGLRARCARTVKKFYAQSVCGTNPNLHKEPCIQTLRKTGKIKCVIKASTKKDGATPTNACSDTANSSSVACPAYTLCIDAADTSGDLIIAAPGDDGMCVPTPTCGDGSFPNCDGTCPAGSVCSTQDLSTCVCISSAQPCGQTAPVCNGECPTGEECGPTGGFPLTGTISCGYFQGYQCGGTCPTDLVCAYFEMTYPGAHGCACAANAPCGMGGLQCPAGEHCAAGPGIGPWCVPNT
jgi:hypothetical protein